MKSQIMKYQYYWITKVYIAYERDLTKSGSSAPSKASREHVTHLAPSKGVSKHLDHMVFGKSSLRKVF